MFFCIGFVFVYVDIEIEFGGRRVGVRDGLYCVLCSRVCVKFDVFYGFVVKMVVFINLFIVYFRFVGI